MPYTRSFPLLQWLGPRHDAIATVATAHAQLGELDGPGRPREIGRPLAHSYVLRVVAEFQGFARDLHDLAISRLVERSGANHEFQPVLIRAASQGRLMDRGNATLDNLESDFRSLGISQFRRSLTQFNGYWEKSLRGKPKRRGDRAYFGELVEIRNALAHGDQTKLDALRARGVFDTVTWTRDRLPGLTRVASALDRIVWGHLRNIIGEDPWMRQHGP